MAFHKNLKTIRQHNNLSQEQFAELLNVSRQAVQKWESGKTHPTIDKLLFLKKKYGISLDDLFDEESKGGYIMIKKSFWSRVENFYYNLSQSEKSALFAFIVIFAGIVIFSLGLNIGRAVYHLFQN